MFLFKRLWCFITKQKLVMLTDFDGTTSVVPAFNVGNKLFAKRYWPYAIRTVRLVDDGRVTTPGNSTCYISYWKYI